MSYGMDLGLDLGLFGRAVGIDGQLLESATGQAAHDHLWERYEARLAEQVARLGGIDGDIEDSAVDGDVAAQLAVADTVIWWHSDDAPNGTVHDDEAGTSRPATRAERNAWFAGELPDHLILD